MFESLLVVLFSWWLNKPPEKPKSNIAPPKPIGAHLLEVRYEKAH